MSNDNDLQRGLFDAILAEAERAAGGKATGPDGGLPADAQARLQELASMADDPWLEDDLLRGGEPEPYPDEDDTPITPEARKRTDALMRQLVEEARARRGF
jgi:hypothetical protein